MFIALEGIDASGKTTLCTLLAEKLGANRYSTPPKKYLTFRERVDRDASAEEHYQFYRDGIYDASAEIEKILAGGNSVVCDRYWLSTYTYHQVMGVSVPKDDFSSIILPTLTVILSLDSDTQIHRLLQRGMSVGDRRMLDKQQELTMAFYQNVLEFGIPFLVINTKHFSSEESAKIVLSSLGVEC